MQKLSMHVVYIHVCIYVCAHDVRSLWRAARCPDVSLVRSFLHSIAHLCLLAEAFYRTPAYVCSRSLHDHSYKSLRMDNTFSFWVFEFGLSHHIMVLVNHHVRVEISHCAPGNFSSPTATSTFCKNCSSRCWAKLSLTSRQCPFPS